MNHNDYTCFCINMHATCCYRHCKPWRYITTSFVQKQFSLHNSGDATVSRTTISELDCKQEQMSSVTLYKLKDLQLVGMATFNDYTWFWINTHATCCHGHSKEQKIDNLVVYFNCQQLICPAESIETCHGFEHNIVIQIDCRQEQTSSWTLYNTLSGWQNNVKHTCSTIQAKP